MQEISEGRERVINVRDIDPGIVTGSSVSCSITLIRRAACNWWWTTIRDRCTTNSRPGMARAATGPTLSKAPTSGVCACGICGTEGGERFARIPSEITEERPAHREHLVAVENDRPAKFVSMSSLLCVRGARQGRVSLC